MSPIIPVLEPDCQVKSWKILLKQAISDPYHLLSLVGLDSHPIVNEVDTHSNFSMRVPQPFIDKMGYGDPNDPLLRQVLTTQQEAKVVAGFSQDPLAEISGKSAKQQGILHKYHGRVLMLLAQTCAVNCRYCFRRHFPYQDQAAKSDQLAQIYDYLAKNHEISEVILSGGDPLIVSDHYLQQFINQIEAIAHIKRLRIHTRLPVVIPQRITADLCQTLAQSRLKTSMVLHINHANEIDPLLASSVQKLKSSGVIIFNQAVLLAGVNDSIAALSNLFEKGFEADIIPYYLHLLDPVAGAAHFNVEKSRALSLMAGLRNQLPGYLVPRLAQELAGEKSKTVLA